MNKQENKIISIKAQKFNIDHARSYYQEGDLERFFGCAPGLTDGLSAREYIEKIREDSE